MATPPTGNPVGCPSAYKPEYCQQVIDAGDEGKSKVEMAAEIGVTRKTFDNWSAEFPEFLLAIESAMERSQAWWEKVGRAHITEQYGEGAAGSKVNANLYSRSMAARFPKDWREKTEQTIQGANGGPVAVAHIDPAQAKQLAKEIAGLV
jgi:transposase